MKYFLVLLIAISLFACVDLNKSTQITAIQKMTKSLDSMDIVLNEHPVNSIEEQQVAYNEIESKIRLNLNVSDTVDLDFGKKLDAIKSIREKFTPLKVAYEQLKSTIKNQRKTLYALEADISKSNGERGEYQNNLDFETKKFNQLKKELEDYTKTRKEVTTVFNQNKVEFENFANSLETN